MKHGLSYTVQLSLWLIVTVFLSLLLVPKALVREKPIDVGTVPLVAVVCGFILLGALFWTFAIKWKMNPKYTLGVLAVLVGSVISRPLIEYTWLNNLVYAPYIGLSFFVIIAAAYVVVVKLMQRSWKNVLLLSSTHNLFFALVLAIAGATMGAQIPYVAAIGILVFSTIYDMWAVWVSKHMVSFAKYFMKVRAFPGFVIPKRKKEAFAILGGGDVVFSIIVPASLYVVSPLLMWATAGGAVAGITALLFGSKKGSFYPALTVVSVGMVIGWLTWLVIV